MNNLLKYSCFILASALILASCKKDETLYSSIYTENFYKTPQDAEAALTAVYGSLPDLYDQAAALMVADFSGDQVYPRSVVGRNTFPLFNYDPNYTTQKTANRPGESPLQVWRACYSGIERANWVIEKVPSINMDATRRTAIEGEAYFLRAFYHWMLTKNFGDIVIKIKASTSSEEAYNAKSAKAAVYKQIYADLDMAVTNLPNYSGTLKKGRPSKQAALTLYTKAALYNEDWATALQKAQTVLTAPSGLALMANVRDVYDVSKEDIARQENLWAYEAESTTPARTSTIMGLFGPAVAGPEYAKVSFGSAFAYYNFFLSFAPVDKRRLLLDTTYVNNSGRVVQQRDITPITRQGVLVKKYQDANSVGSVQATNIPILRFAEIYLIAAEAEARLNGATTLAYTNINTIRRRAGVADLAPGLSKNDFINAVIQERSWEFFAEADRWYDLTRTGLFLTVIPVAVNDVYPVRPVQQKHKYFPIPQDEINANPKLEQNPEWR